MYESLTISRVLVGVFFAISGWHKLLNPDRHRLLVRTLTADHVPLVWFNQWWVPIVEFTAGCALALGIATPLAAFLLFVLMEVAIVVDGSARIPNMHPLDTCDRLACFLYLPETLFLLLLVPFLFGGGPWSLDALLW